MTNPWNLLRQRFSASDTKSKAEIAQIGILQQAAAQRRAEYAAEKEKSEPQPATRKRMEAAEAAHTAALQAWENKQSRQKSR